MSTLVDTLNGWIWSTPSQLPWLVVLLLFTGIFVTIRMGFVQLRQVKHAVLVVTGRFDKDDDHGDLNHFQALSTALSATVGIGNIAGVAIAIHYGGPGALFWMWITAFFGMALKYAECTLATTYRDFDANGNVAGGPMYYIEKGLGPKWKPVAITFATCGMICSFATGNMNQANTMAVSAASDFGASPYFVGVVAALLVAAVILGGVKRIGMVSGRLAPMMAFVYVAAALTVLIFNAPAIPAAFATIVQGAFNPAASLGGSVAGVFSISMLWGIKRGLYSNEAGQGSAPIAHAAAKTDEPVREGAVAMLEPLIDTLIICTMTGLVIVTTGVWDQKRDAQLPVQHSKIIATQAWQQAQGSNAWERRQDAMTRTKAMGNTAIVVDVTAGQQDTLQFVAYDGMVETPRLLNADNQPFTGKLRFIPAEGHLSLAAAGETASVDDLVLSGKMLQSSSALTAWAFQKGLAPLGDWGNLVVTFCVFMFALSTMVSWSYYGDRCVEYLFGTKYVIYYRLAYTCFVFMGAILALEVVWAFGDLCLGLMSIPNLIAVLALSPKVRAATVDYFNRMKNQETGGNKPSAPAQQAA